VFLTALLVRIGLRKPRDGSASTARERLQRVLLRDKIPEAPKPPPPRKPSPEELIESGTLKILPGQVERPLPRPAPASFHLPAAGWRLAGLAYNADGTLYAAVQLLPDDAFWLDDRRFPHREWRSVRMGGAVRRVQRVALDLFVESPSEGGDPGCWMPLRLHATE